MLSEVVSTEHLRSGFNPGRGERDTYLTDRFRLRFPKRHSTPASRALFLKNSLSRVGPVPSGHAHA